MRSDESTHRFVNHSLANLKSNDINPFALREPDMTVKGKKIAYVTFNGVPCSTPLPCCVALTAMRRGSTPKSRTVFSTSVRALEAFLSISLRALPTDIHSFERPTTQSQLHIMCTHHTNVILNVPSHDLPDRWSLNNLHIISGRSCSPRFLVITSIRESCDICIFFYFKLSLLYIVLHSR